METTNTSQEKIEFSGNAKEYFGIWITNIILSIITLGIYSAWAKVKNKTYFNNNTKIQANGFGYHATGKQILKGRLIAVAIIVSINFLSLLVPSVELISIAVLLIALPWIINTSMRFSSRVTSYRNIRFNWQGTYWKTLWFFILAPFLAIFSLGLLLPLVVKPYYSYFAKSYSYGGTQFNAEAGTLVDYYKSFLIGALLPTLALTAIVYFAVVNSFYDPIIMILSLFVIFLFFLDFLYRIICRNIFINSLNLGDVASFNSNINPIKVVWISLSNVIAIICSLSLLMPWAKVRMYRYLCDHTAINIQGDIDKFVDEEQTKQSALGEAFIDLEGIEAGI